MRFSTLALAPAVILGVTASPLVSSAPRSAKSAIVGKPVYANGGSIVKRADPAYQDAVLTDHNAHRSNHSAPALSWGDDLESSASVLAQRCVFQHDTSINGGGYGQNLAAGYTEDDIQFAITDGWYNEAPNFDGQYGQPTPDQSTFDSYGHFTQVVWIGSSSVGCVTYNCDNSPQGGLTDTDGNVLQGLNWFTVCNYSPPGNYLGEFDKNVMPPLGQAPFNPQSIDISGGQ